MKILIWATSFGADLWCLAKYLDGRSDVQLKILLADPEVFLREGISRVYPFKAEMIKRCFYHHLIGVLGFRPDVTIMDNWLPYHQPSPRGLILWHGFGWKGPNDIKEFSYLHRSIKRAWGSGMEPNRNFRWHTFGPWDFEHRTRISGFHPNNCRQVGAASHDYLRLPVAKEVLQDFYPFDVIGRKTVLIAPTWHYGEVFAHWGKDFDIMNHLLTELELQQTNVILRLHDSFRYDKKYLQLLRDLLAKHENMLIKFKNHSPDNMLDMQVADVMVTNFSSIANLYYATGRPTIHIYPVADIDQEFMWRRYTPVGIYKKKISSVRFIWKLPPEENGGLIARSPGELQELIQRGLQEPNCCREQSERFLQKYMLGADGGNCQRIWSVLQELVME